MLKGQLYLVYNQAADTCSLWCHLTGERVQLEGRWGLGFHEGEGILVSPVGEPSLAADFLACKVEEDDGECVVRCAGAAAMPLHRFLAAHMVKQLVMQPLAAEPFLLEVAQFSRANGGATIWWSMQSFYEKLGLQQGTASQWYHKRWLQWQAWLAKLGLRTPHLRRAVGAQTSRSVKARDTEPDEALWRVLPFYSVSTYAFLALLVRLSSKQWSQLKDKEHQLAFEHFLAAWLLQLLPKSAKLTIYLEGVEHVPGLGLAGEQPVELKLENGQVDLTGLIESSWPRAQQWCKGLALFLVRPKVDLQGFLGEVFLKGAAMQLLFIQLVVLLGIMVEDAAARALQPDAARGNAVEPSPMGASGAADRSHRHSRMKEKLAHEAATKLKHKVAERRLQYFMATRQAFTGQQVYHMAVDCSRIGKQNIMAGVVALPDGTMAICPPQAIRPNPNESNSMYVGLALTFSCFRRIGTDMLLVEVVNVL